MNQPTEEARKAAKALGDMLDFLSITIESVASEIDDATGLPALKARVAELEGALRESLAINVNWVSEAEPETLAYYSEYKAVIAQARKALSNPKEA